MPKIKTSKKVGNGINIKVSLDFPTEKILDKASMDKCGKLIVSNMISFMEKGISPVNGTKFQKYKNVEKYPGKVMKDHADKKKSPVNLKLSGKMYKELTWIKATDKSFKFGYINPTEKVGVYSAVHNRDDRGRPDIPERRFLPTRSGEVFNKTIMLNLKRFFVDRIKELLKKG